MPCCKVRRHAFHETLVSREAAGAGNEADERPLCMNPYFSSGLRAPVRPMAATDSFRVFQTGERHRGDSSAAIADREIASVVRFGAIAAES